ncbi:DNA repair ATPase [Janthinobacterium sp. 17J80-10]|uniref:DNA repair ATPase n=1 Tax=Janthinobacterium sp. 17J80-10 TaxID=2497863 RepID=UPI0010058D26|nr:DNA repair ATPase [Janthinobacterium sp. 17J80-10]QAU32717.1 AAA family ATPase [Janthinobacterium sp. 17J80-10]
MSEVTTEAASTRPAAPDAGSAEQSIAQAVAGSSSFDLLRKRLGALGKDLLDKAGAVNHARLNEFGREDMTLLARTRARTENNCVARDLVPVGDVLVFGYNVFIGLRQETRVADVFALYRLRADGDQYELDAVALEQTFLNDPRFVAEFRELYNYYRNAQLVQLRVTQGKFLAAFKIGERITDVRVFRWQIKDSGEVTYIDNRGERDIALPPAYDFEWTATTREQHVLGKHPHVNVLDTLFVETIGGDLTIKVENNTETGLGIYTEPVEDRNQSLNDADIAYAAVGELVLLRIKPYRETTSRHLVFNRRTRQVTRVDAIGASCVQLPEDHGIVFPGGYMLQSGECKLFGDLPEGLQFKRRLLAPNGEDVLYVFYSIEKGMYVILTYNLINKTLDKPLMAHGYARFDDGRMLLFTAESEEPTRNHPMQLWQTPFHSDEHAARQAPRQTFFGKIGNRELVRGLSELYSIARLVQEQDAAGQDQLPTRFVYETLIRQSRRVTDAYPWLAEAESRQAAGVVRGMIEVASATLDEFDKVAAIRQEAQRTLQQTEQAQRQLLTETASRLWQSPTDFIEALEQIRLARGRLASLREQRYMDVARLTQLDGELGVEEGRVSERTVQFLAQDDAFARINAELDRHRSQLPNLHTTAELAPLHEALDKTAHNLNGLNELLGTLAVGDATLRTRILDAISGIYASVNKLRAEARQRKKQLSQGESAAEFAAQFKLFGQAVESALEQAETPERCDDLLTRLLAQLEDLEGRFAEQEEYLAEIAHKREAVYEALETRKQTLLDARQRRVQAIMDAARRILAGVPKRLAQLREAAQLEAYFASDALLGKLKSSIEEMRKLGNNVGADDLAGQLKNLREQGQRALRDRNELVTGNTIRLGRHAFTVNQQALDLTIVPREERLAFHLTGTDYFSELNDERLQALHAYWAQESLAESQHVYRAEYLAYQIILAAQAEEEGWRWTELLAAARQTGSDGQQFDDSVRRFAAPRYHEGYQKGIHDHDAAAILRQLAPLFENAGLLRYSPLARAVALLYWQDMSATPSLQMAAQTLQHQAEQAELMRRQFGSERLWQQISTQLQQALQKFLAQQQLALDAWLDPATESPAILLEQAAAYLLAELGAQAGLASRAQAHEWVLSRAASDLAQGLQQHLARHNIAPPWQDAAHSWRQRWQLATEWLHGYISQQQLDLTLLPEAAAALLCTLSRRIQAADLQAPVQGLLGEHPRIAGQGFTLQLNDFMRRLQHHTQVVVPAFRQLQQLRQTLAQDERAALRLEQFQAKPLSSFVRNRLIDEVYLPLVGDNLAKQIGAAGDQRRTDSMGMLLLISPPGYGKTTLMEYLCDRLGMIFVRINCPVLGHGVTSLDPAQAANSAARMELEKLNLGLAMGNNVMLYLDDIQHTHPEFLQKFISLADGTRRVEGVWRGESRSYDLRGKRFAIVMAGNPYTESGDVFKIPDMLANRADIYNLGDVLSGREEAFAMSYIENALAGHPVLQPLAAREPQDIQRLMRMATGEPVPASDLKHGYSAQEISEICAVLQRLFKVRDALLAVNLAYIASAAQDDAYRAEPPFKLQGSYRNMSKLVPRVSALMSDQELDNLLRDHYRGEAQTLTTGAEENLLKLAHLLGQPNADEQARWKALLEDFVRLRKQGGADADGATRVANLLGDISQQIAALGLRLQPEVQINLPEQELLQIAIGRLTDSYEKSLMPMLSAMNHKMRLDHSIWDGVREMSANVKELEKRLGRLQPVKEKPAAAAHKPAARKHDGEA